MGAFGKARSAGALKRKSRGFIELSRTLIVCEGSKTEPFYLKSLIRALGLSAASVLVVGQECESAPISVYEYADSRFIDDGPFDEVFCVFDRDRHDTFERACAAISTHQSGVFKAIVSYPCFEYWILLHFKYTRAPCIAQGANSPGDMMLKAVRDVWPKYAKGKSDVFNELARDDGLARAAERARRARADAIATGDLNPSTDIDLLVDRLKVLAEAQFNASKH